MRFVFSLALLLALACRAPAADDVVLLKDGQTLEGKASVLPSGEVEMEVATSDGGVLRVRLDATAVERIERAADVKEERLASAVVRLVDGREITGQVRIRGGDVVVKGSFGEVAFAREDVEAITPVVPEPPRVVLDGDLGLLLPLPPGWAADEAEGLGERLRIVRRDGRARISALLRSASPDGRTPESQVRAALLHDVGSGATITRRDDGRVLVRDRVVDPAVAGQLVELIGIAEVDGSRVVWIRALLDPASSDAALAAEVEGLAARRAWLAPGVSRDGAFFRDPALRLLVEAAPGFRGEAASGTCVATFTSPQDPSARLDVHVVEDDDPQAALLDLVEPDLPEGDKGAKAKLELTPLPDGRGVRGQAGLVRAVALRCDEGRVAVVVVRAGSVERLAELSAGVATLDPGAGSAALAVVEQLLPQRGEAAERLAAGDSAGAARAVDLVLQEAPDDPEALSLKVACARAAGDQAALRDALDAAWVAGGAPWVGEALGRALVAHARTLGEAGTPEALDAAVDAVERAAEAWPDAEVGETAARLLIDAAKRAFEKGEQGQAWARFARARLLLGGREDLDKAERDLRLAAAKAFIQAGDSLGARREARRAYALGAADKAVDDLYARAEQLDRARESAEAAARRNARGPGGGGEFSFGLPPTKNQSGRQRRIQPTAFERPTSRTGRVRDIGATNSVRRARIRAQPSRSGTRVQPTRYTGKGRRVRTNGELVFSGGS